MPAALRRELSTAIAGAVLELPPLRQRPADLAELARSFAGRAGVSIDEAALALLSAHRWPGNIAELSDVIERAALVSTDRVIREANVLGLVDRSAPTDDEAARITAALEATGGNQSAAAKLLGISRHTLLRRLDAYGIPRPRKGRRS